MSTTACGLLLGVVFSKDGPGMGDFSMGACDLLPISAGGLLVAVMMGYLSTGLCDTLKANCNNSESKQMKVKNKTEMN
jgi:hypothetical protein